MVAIHRVNRVNAICFWCPDKRWLEFGFAEVYGGNCFGQELEVPLFDVLVYKLIN